LPALTSVEQIAARDKCSIRQVNMTISLAFLAPELVKAAIERRLPRGIAITRLRDAPADRAAADRRPRSGTVGARAPVVAAIRDARFVDLIRRRSAKEVQYYGVQP
jgi:hypothetical protein